MILGGRGLALLRRRFGSGFGRESVHLRGRGWEHGGLGAGAAGN